MSREANMEMIRGNRQHEHEKKFGKDKERPSDPDHNKKLLAGIAERREAAMKEHEHPSWGKGKGE